MANIAQVGVGIRNDGGPGSRAFQRDAARVGSSAKKAARDVKNLQKNMGAAGATAKSASGSMMKMVGVLGAAAVIISATKAISKFEETMALAGKVARASGEQFEKMAEQAKMLGATTRFTASDAAEGLLFLGRAGFDAEQAMAALPSTLNLAAAGVMSLGAAADLASNVVKQFGLEAIATVRVVDALIIVSNRSNTSVTQLGEAMKYVGPVANAMGLSVEATASAVGALGDAGIQGSMAGTNLRGVFSALLGPTAKAARALEMMGLEITDLNLEADGIANTFSKLSKAGMTAADAVAIFGRRNAAAALVLADSTEKMRELEEATILARGEAADMAKVMDDTLGGALRALKSAFEGLMLSTGDSGLTASLRFLAETATGVLRTLAGLGHTVEKNKTLIVGLTMVIQFLAVRFAILIAVKVALFFKDIILNLKTVIIGMRATTVASTQLSVALAALGGWIGIAITALAALATVLFTMGGASAETTARLKELDDATESASNTFDEFLHSADDISVQFSMVERVLEGVEERVKTLGKAFKNADLVQSFQLFMRNITPVGAGGSSAKHMLDLKDFTTDEAKALMVALKKFNSDMDGVMNELSVVVNTRGQEVQEGLAKAFAGVEDAKAAAVGPRVLLKAYQTLGDAQKTQLDYMAELARQGKLLARIDGKDVEAINAVVDQLNKMGHEVDHVTASVSILQKMIAKGLGIEDGVLSQEAMNAAVKYQIWLRKKTLGLLDEQADKISESATDEQTQAILQRDLTKELGKTLTKLSQSTEARQADAIITNALKTVEIEREDVAEKLLQTLRDTLIVELQKLDIGKKQEKFNQSFKERIALMKAEGKITQLLINKEDRKAAIAREILTLQTKAGKENLVLTNEQILEMEVLAGVAFDLAEKLKEVNDTRSRFTGDTPEQKLANAWKAISANVGQTNKQLMNQIDLAEAASAAMRVGLAPSKFTDPMERRFEEESMRGQMKETLLAAQPTGEGGVPQALSDEQLAKIDTEIEKWLRLKEVLEEVLGIRQSAATQRTESLSAQEQLAQLLETQINRNDSLNAVTREAADLLKEKAATEEIAALAALANAGATDVETAAIAELILKLQELRTANAGLHKANEKNIEGQREMERIQNSIADSFTNMVTDIITGAKSAGEAIQDFTKAIAEMILKQIIAGTVTKIFMAGIGMPMVAKGGVFDQRGITPFASGGVVNGPTVFPMASGGVGLMGEDGPEAVLPLKRDSKGRLGVLTAGDGGAGPTKIVNVNMTVNTPDANSFKRSRGQIAAQIRQAGES